MELLLKILQIANAWKSWDDDDDDNDNHVDDNDDAYHDHDNDNDNYDDDDDVEDNLKARLLCRHKIERKSFGQKDSLQRQPAGNIMLIMRKYNDDYDEI